MAVNETQEASKTQGNRKPWVMLLVVIITYGLWFIGGVVIFVWGNWLYIKTGNKDLVDMTMTYLGTVTIGISFEGLGTMIWSYWMIKGLLNRSNVLRILAYIENGFKVALYGYLCFGFILSIATRQPPASSKTFGDSDVLIYNLEGWWGVLVYGIIFLVSAFRIYVLSRKDVRALFQNTTPAPAVPEEASG